MKKTYERVDVLIIQQEELLMASQNAIDIDDSFAPEQDDLFY